MYSYLKYLSYFFNFYFVVFNNFINFSKNIKNNNKSSNISKYCNCCKNDEKIIKKEDIINEKTINDLKLDKNIPKDFIKNNKERVFKMIKVFNKDFKNEDIDEILLLIYNLGKYEKWDCCKLLFNKLKIDKNKDVISIVHDKNEKNEDIIFIFYYKKDILNRGSVFFNNSNILEDRTIDFTGPWKVKIVNKIQKTLTDIFYNENIEKGKNFPINLFYKICIFLYIYYQRDSVFKNFKDYEFKKEIEFFLKNNKVEIDLKKDEISIEKPIYIYLNETLGECYLVENEKQFRILTNNIEKKIEQIILKISSDKVEFFKCEFDYSKKS
jgi:hypothetical protein